MERMAVTRGTRPVWRTGYAQSSGTAPLIRSSAAPVGTAPSRGTLSRLKVIDDAAQDLVEVHLRFVADQGRDLSQVGHPPWHVFEPRLVGLLVRDERNLR